MTMQLLLETCNISLLVSKWQNEQNVFWLLFQRWEWCIKIKLLSPAWGSSRERKREGIIHSWYDFDLSLVAAAGGDFNYDFSLLLTVCRHSAPDAYPCFLCRTKNWRARKSKVSLLHSRSHVSQSPKKIPLFCSNDSSAFHSFDIIQSFDTWYHEMIML